MPSRANVGSHDPSVVVVVVFVVVALGSGKEDDERVDGPCNESNVHRVEMGARVFVHSFVRSTLFAWWVHYSRGMYTMHAHTARRESTSHHHHIALGCHTQGSALCTRALTMCIWDQCHT